MFQVTLTIVAPNDLYYRPGRSTAGGVRGGRYDAQDLQCSGPDAGLSEKQGGAAAVDIWSRARTGTIGRTRKCTTTRSPRLRPISAEGLLSTRTPCARAWPASSERCRRERGKCTFQTSLDALRHVVLGDSIKNNGARSLRPSPVILSKE